MRKPTWLCSISKLTHKRQIECSAFNGDPRCALRFQQTMPETEEVVLQPIITMLRKTLIPTCENGPGQVSRSEEPITIPGEFQNYATIFGKFDGFTALLAEFAEKTTQSQPSHARRSNHATVWPTLELFLTDGPRSLVKEENPATGTTSSIRNPEQFSQEIR
jgi:hypothetical protein